MRGTPVTLPPPAAALPPPPRAPFRPAPPAPGPPATRTGPHTRATPARTDSHRGAGPRRLARSGRPACTGAGPRPLTEARGVPRGTPTTALGPGLRRGPFIKVRQTRAAPSNVVGVASVAELRTSRVPGCSRWKPGARGRGETRRRYASKHKRRRLQGRRPALRPGFGVRDSPGTAPSLVISFPHRIDLRGSGLRLEDDRLRRTLGGEGISDLSRKGIPSTISLRPLVYGRNFGARSRGSRGFTPSRRVPTKLISLFSPYLPSDYLRTISASWFCSITHNPR